MSDVSANLSLPYIQPSQAQKHVTHNQGMLRLDALVQLSVSAINQTDPPALPQSGNRFILPANPTSDWAGQAGMLAVFEDNAWEFYQPQIGWVAWVDAISEQRVYDGSAWVEVTASINFQNLDHVGINTTADLTNRLSVSSDATLLTHDGDDHQLKINKSSTGDTASLLFQTGWSGRAEMGTNGNDDFSIKTSDGTSWFNSLQCSSTNGRISLPSGISGRIEVFDLGRSIFIGDNAGLSDDLSDNSNVFIGNECGRDNTTGERHVAIGYLSMRYNTTGLRNSAIGYAALRDNISGSNNVALGYSALIKNTTGSNNVAFGYGALLSNLSGINNVGLGRDSLRFTTTGTNNETYSNSVGLGYATRVSGSNQIQLGNSSTTAYAFGAIQDRSDARDKTDIRNTKLGLDFINHLRPVDFRWDLRDDYVEQVEVIDEKTGNIIGANVINLKKDGSRKRGRYHHGLIAQEVADAIEKVGVDFGGFQDHSRSGGDEVLSLGYTELICPLIKAVQELAERVKLLEDNPVNS